MREREGLIARIRQIRGPAQMPTTPKSRPVRSDETELQGLQTRIEHLEQLVEALQDSVHRESARQGRRIAELEARIEPAALSVALDRNARERGL